MASKPADQVQDKILLWGSENLRDFPWRDGDKSVYEVFIAEFFLTQTPPENVGNIYPSFLQKYPSLAEIDAAPNSEIRSDIRPLGFQSMRADALKEIARKHDRLPKTTSQFRELPRVGRYVANATLSFADARPLPIVDRNVDRIYARLFPGGYPTRDSRRWAFASKMLPQKGEEARMFNLSLIDFGSLVCTKSSPNCEGCPLAEECNYRRD